MSSVSWPCPFIWWYLCTYVRRLPFRACHFLECYFYFYHTTVRNIKIHLSFLKNKIKIQHLYCSQVQHNGVGINSLYRRHHLVTVLHPPNSFLPLCRYHISTLSITYLLRSSYNRVWKFHNGSSVVERLAPPPCLNDEFSTSFPSSSNPSINDCMNASCATMSLG